MKVIIAYLLFVSVFSLSGCTGISYNSDDNTATDFSLYKTFRWRAPNAFNKTSDVYLQNGIAGQRIRSEVETVLTKTALTYLENGKASAIRVRST